MKGGSRALIAFALIISVSPATVAAEDRGAVREFVHDELSDYRNFFSWPNAEWLGIGGLTALAVHPADEPIHEHVLKDGTTTLPGAFLYGSQTLQVPVAVGLWVAGHAAGNARAAATGRDLLRAQISVFSWTNAIKWGAQRTRPNGDPRSFPSGHASASFAAATVVQAHYGWKLGVPALAAAAYTATSRVTVDEHWLSDVAFGAALGLVCGRTVTVRLRDRRLLVAPVASKRGGAIVLTLARSL